MAHKANDSAWEAIQAVGEVGIGHFEILQQLGSGDIGTVYLAQLKGPGKIPFAIKVMDNGSLASRNKLHRAHTEKAILATLDHPFLPTLYAQFETRRFSCLVMDYCLGGDLHVLRQNQHGKCFEENVVRFYAAEVLLSLEYLHMMGVVYRDLKPENVLVRQSGHIMLSDFDLSLVCDVNPTVHITPPVRRSTALLRRLVSRRILSCVAPAPARSGTAAGRVAPVLVVEPTEARSMSFVGTHEYLAPEIIAGCGHGAAVDWWTFGIFLYELLYGRTPFRGSSNEATLVNVLQKPLEFPVNSSEVARSLIEGLLDKDPDIRMASERGAGEIKQHPFFAGVNWALIRHAEPPFVPDEPEKKQDATGAGDFECF